MEPYIPNQDPQALIWMQNLAQKLTDFPGTYMVTPADALALTNAVSAFAAVLPAALNPDTRSKTAIMAKDTARNTATAMCRQFAGLIRANAGISDEDMVAAGIRPPNNEREAIECPQTVPLVNPVAATMGSHTVRYADSMTPETAAKPFGATDLLLFCAVADEHVTDPSLAKFVGKFTKNPISVDFSAGDNGKQATYFARWSSRKGEMGPWSNPVSMAIAA